MAESEKEADSMSDSLIEEQKVTVPGGMLRAAVSSVTSAHSWIPNQHDPTHSDRQCTQCGAIDCSSEGEEPCIGIPPWRMHKVIQAALLWQKENAPAPTDEQCRKMIGEGLHHSDYEYDLPSVRFGAAEWMRCMYDEPKPEVLKSDVRGEVHRLFHWLWSACVGQKGYDKEKWNKMDSLLQQAMYPPVHNAEPDFNEAWNDCTVEINRVGGVKKAAEILRSHLTPEPEVPEAVKGLLWDWIGFSGGVAEARDAADKMKRHNEGIVKSYEIGRRHAKG